MIPFNVPPYAGPEMECLEKAAKINRKICGDGEFTKKVSAWLEERTAGVEGISDNILHERTGDGSASVRDRRG